MAPDRPLYSENRVSHRNVDGAIRRAVPMWGRAHDQFHHIDQIITRPTPSDHQSTHPPNPRAPHITRFPQSYRNAPSWRFAGDLVRHQVAPHGFQQDARDGLHSPFIQHSGIPTRGRPQTTAKTLFLPSLIARLNLYSSPDIPRHNPTQPQAPTAVHRRQALLGRSIEDMLQDDKLPVLDNPVPSPKPKTTVKSAAWVGKVCRKRRCSDLFNKNFSFGPASQSNSSQHSPQVSPRSSISSASSISLVGQPAKRQRVDSSNSEISHSRSEISHSRSAQSPGAIRPDRCRSIYASSTTHSCQHATGDIPLYSTPHPGHPVDFTTPQVELYDECGSIIEPESYESSIHDDCFEPYQRRASFPKAYLRHQIAEEFARRGRLKHEEARDEMERARVIGWASSVASSNDAAQKSSSASSDSSARTSSSGATDSMEAFLRHVRASFEARKRKGLDSMVFEDDVGRAYASSEPL
jgi:hypothetical protein